MYGMRDVLSVYDITPLFIFYKELLDEIQQGVVNIPCSFRGFIALIHQTLSTKRSVSMPGFESISLRSSEKYFTQ